MILYKIVTTVTDLVIYITALIIILYNIKKNIEGSRIDDIIII